ncbi:hypothetical protein BO79DRAFT_27447 [Aspergillus costaricaensis CBS 115574]|uniref:Uncharacterized protein n=1 Tax=Aspergillus costaricaensis CBS 115574 TaxID=1448317 RepID=A0ACD1ITJ3_9EURO|nr:hypothetical protein BO79DRAFT_27447 [Aspergillus costaricaensis CBS 115574]RAK93927.1 hypothetical protein BO79DRAFT_27447 [Aspergillus costaricaensis CBS 115574]
MNATVPMELSPPPQNLVACCGAPTDPNRIMFVTDYPSRRNRRIDISRNRFISYLLDVVVAQGAAILKLLTSEDKTLLIRGDTLLVLDLGLDVVDGVARLDVEGNGLTREGLDETIDRKEAWVSFLDSFSMILFVPSLSDFGLGFDGWLPGNLE